MFGLFSAGMDPLGIRLSARHIPHNFRGLACGFYLGGIYWGSSIASLSLIMAENIGWRLTYVAIGGLGILLAITLVPSIPSKKKTNPEEGE